MDLEIIIIGFFCLAIVVLPILYVQQKQKKKKAKLIAEFMQLARQHQLTVSQHDFWDPFYAIGIDSAKNLLFYARTQAGKEQEVIVNLSEVRQCSVINNNREANNGMIIDSIELALTYRDSKKPGKVLMFYDREESLILSEELRLAEKWKEIVNASLAPGQTADLKAAATRG